MYPHNFKGCDGDPRPSDLCDLLATLHNQLINLSPAPAAGSSSWNIAPAEIHMQTLMNSKHVRIQSERKGN